MQEFFGEVSNYDGFFVLRHAPNGLQKVDLPGLRPIVPVPLRARTAIRISPVYGNTQPG